MAAEALLAVSALSTVASAAGTLSAGNQYNTMQTINQQVMYQRAQTIEQQSQAQAAIEKNQTERKLGQIGAAYGASGVDASQGTPLEVLADSAAQGELQRNLTLWGGRVNANAAITQGNIDAYEGGLATQNAAWEAGTTLLTGGLKTAKFGKDLGVWQF